jgi:hypothetical protein
MVSFLSDSDPVPSPIPSSSASSSQSVPSAKTKPKVVRKKIDKLEHESFAYKPEVEQVNQPPDFRLISDLLLSEANKRHGLVSLCEIFFNEIINVKQELKVIKENMNDKDAEILRHVEVIQKLIKMSLKAEHSESSINWTPPPPPTPTTTTNTGGKTSPSSSSSSASSDMTMNISKHSSGKYKISSLNKNATFIYKEIIKTIPSVGWNSSDKCWVFSESNISDMERIFKDKNITYVIE